jgi:cob(I)alamin adenosyltransferase
MMPSADTGIVWLSEVCVLAEPAGLEFAMDDAAQGDAERHKAKMARRKAAQDAEVAAKPIEAKGLLIVHTGKGKGKSTAAFGLALRALGRGWRVGVVQFIKGAWSTGERAAFERFGDQMIWRTMGEGFTWETQDRARDVAAAKAALEAAAGMLADPDLHLVVLDELNIVLRYGTLSVEEVLDVLRARRPGLHVVVTGRNAQPALVEAADLVTEMRLVKHPFREGMKGQLGVEF